MSDSEMNNMCKVNLILKGGNGRNGEGVWAEYVCDVDKACGEDENRKGDTFNVTICNHPVTTDKIKYGDTVSVLNMGQNRPVLSEPV